ncbi:type 2 lanthipeptide synthetase LanM family protein [Microbacterium lacticum]
MAFIEVERVQRLFPELDSGVTVNDLLNAISSLRADSIPAPAHELEELAFLPETAWQLEKAAYVGFDGFSRAVCDDQRSTFLNIFSRSRSAREHAEHLADAAWGILVDRVQQLSVRTLVACMHTLREQGMLRGDTAEDRYAYFCLLSGSPAFVQSLRRVFPELGAQIARVTSGMTTATRTFIERLDDAMATGVLKKLLREDSSLTKLRWTGSDSHSGGQSVLIAEFGTERIVYKPRSMAAEASFNELIHRFNQVADISLPILATETGSNHGWQEYADGLRPTDRELYYRQCGHLLAILHVVGASDMHYENVLNHAGGPAVVDAETLFAVNLRRSDDGSTADPAMIALANSVFSTGFLPARIDAGIDVLDSVDIGFLGYEPGQTAVTASVMFREAGTDRMYVDFGMGEILASSVAPVAETVTDEPRLVATGFASLYDWILENRDTVSAWVTELFASVSVRAVLDNTRKYYQLLSLSTHPEFQMSTELTNVLFHRCAIGRLEHVTPEVIRAEIADLLNRDIPYFSLRTDRTEVFDSRGQAVANTLAETPINRVLSQISAMSPLSRDFNIRVIRSTFVNKVDPGLDRPLWDLVNASSNRPGHVPATSMQAVRDIADEYLRFAIDVAPGNPTEWLGATLSNTAEANPWRFRQLPDGLYAGCSGVALFLTAAGTRFEDTRYTDCAERFLVPRAMQLLASAEERRREIVGGMGGGYPGLAYTLINGARITGRTAWESAGLELWSQLPEDIPFLTEADQLMGTAGVLAASSWLLSDPGVPEARREHIQAAAAIAYRELCDHAPELASGQQVNRRQYSGYAHGLSGLIAALTLYGLHEPEAAERVPALESTFSTLFEEVPLPYAMSNDAPDYRAHGWCHGAPGILSAEQIRHRYGSRDRSRQIDVLIDATSQECLDLNFSLCHGDIGNLIILQQAARLRQNEKAADLVKEKMHLLENYVLPSKLADRDSKSVLNDALMVGLPGVGYGLLQLEGMVKLPDLFTFGLI